MSLWKSYFQNTKYTDFNTQANTFTTKSVIIQPILAKFSGYTNKSNISSEFNSIISVFIRNNHNNLLGGVISDYGTR